MRFRREPATPESSPGGPVYDAMVDPVARDPIVLENLRLQLQATLHQQSKLDPARHSSPALYDGLGLLNPMAEQLMFQAEQRDRLGAVTDRTWELPFPGVTLGPMPAFSASPPEWTVQQPHGFGGNRESLRAGRARFAR